MLIRFPFNSLHSRGRLREQDYVLEPDPQASREESNNLSRSLPTQQALWHMGPHLNLHHSQGVLSRSIISTSQKRKQVWGISSSTGRNCERARAARCSRLLGPHSSYTLLCSDCSLAEVLISSFPAFAFQIVSTYHSLSYKRHFLEICLLLLSYLYLYLLPGKKALVAES